MTPLAQRFRRGLAIAAARLATVPEARAGEHYPGGTWTRIQVVGHLIDSALNNHQRFVRAGLQGSYDGPLYDQEAWVDIHGYDAMAWREVLDHWQHQNALLARVVDRLPESHLGAPCVVGGALPAWTLEQLVDDYVRHLNHHVDQILSGL